MARLPLLPLPIPVPRRSAPTPAVTAGGLVARTFSTFWKRLWIFAALTLVVLVPAYTIAFGGLFLTLRPAEEGPAVVLSFVLAVLVWLAIFMQACCHTYGAVQHLSGRPVHLGAMLRAGFGRLLAVLGLLGLGALAYAAVLALIAAVVAFLGRSGLVAAALAAISVPFLLFLGTALAVTLPVLVVERAGPIAALRRSWVLTRGRRGATFAALLVVGLALAGIVAAPFGLFAATQLGAGGLPDTGPATSVGMMVLMLAVWILAAPLFPIVSAVAYHDLRLEKEGDADLARVFQ